MQTAGQILIDQALPPEMRGRYRTLDGKTVAAIMQEIAEKYPDQYRPTLKKLMDFGQEIAYRTGGYSFGLRDMLPDAEATNLRESMRAKIRGIVRDKTLSREARNKAISELLAGSQADMVRTTYEAGRKSGNPLAMQVASGARGKPDNVKSLMLGEGEYLDHRERPIPYAILSGFSEGLAPAEYFAGAFGNRKGLIDVKTGTGNSGYLSKLMGRTAHRLVVTDTDDEDEERGKLRGLPVDVSDPDNPGSLLAFPVRGYPRNTPLTPAILKELSDAGISRIVVRSPVAFGAKDGGVYARDVGIREKGLPQRGDMVGVAGAQSLSEPTTQSMLGRKHAGGSAAAGPSGFKYLQMIINAPGESPWWAAHAQKAGIVRAVRPSATGGEIVDVDGEEHVTAPGSKALVKIGDSVDAGDVLSDGLENPNEFVKFKGIGEGRRMYVGALAKAYAANRIQANRRNIEILSRGAVNHVRMDDELDDWLPGDVVPYDRLEAAWKPRAGYYPAKPRAAVGRYLESPVLHHSIGTKLTKKMADELDEFGIEQVSIHDDPPPFTPEFQSGADVLLNDPDWQVGMYGSNQEKVTLNSAWRGSVSDETGTSFVPALAKGIGFGTYGKISR